MTLDKDTARKAAKVGTDGDLVQEFMKFAYYVYELRFTTENGILIHPIEMPKGKVKISIVILDNTTIKQIEKSWYEINKWREALIEWQGLPIDEANNFYENLSKAQTEGISYNQLATKVNQRISEFVIEYIAWLDDEEKYQKQFGEYNYHLWFHDYIKKPEHNRPASLKFASDLLHYCRPKLSEEERQLILESILERIKIGDNSFIANGELVQGKRDIRERIDYWRKKQKEVGNTS